MTKKEFYICDICRSSFTTQKDAEKCEKAHTYPQKIAWYKFIKNLKYPLYIKVDMDNGDMKKYELVEDDE